MRFGAGSEARLSSLAPDVAALPLSTDRATRGRFEMDAPDPDAAFRRFKGNCPDWENDDDEVVLCAPSSSRDGDGSAEPMDCAVARLIFIAALNP